MPSTTLSVSILNSTLTSDPLFGRTCLLICHDDTRRDLRHPAKIYSPECVEEEFSEVHGSKQPLRRSAKHSTTAWWHTVSVETLRVGSRSCTIKVCQGVATRNDATT